MRSLLGMGTLLLERVACSASITVVAVTDIALNARGRPAEIGQFGGGMTAWQRSRRASGGNE